MRESQISLGNMPIKKNKEFLRALYGSEELEQSKKWFDKLDCSRSWQSEKDTSMTLDKFLGLMNSPFHIVLQNGSPEPDKIRYCASSKNLEPTIFAWVVCPYNENNYRVISRLFEQVYGQKIDSVRNLISTKKSRR